MQVSEAGAQAQENNNTEAVTAVAPTISQEERKIVISLATEKAIQIYATIDKLYTLTSEYHEIAYKEAEAGEQMGFNSPYFDDYTAIAEKIERLIAGSIAMSFKQTAQHIQI